MNKRLKFRFHMRLYHTLRQGKAAQYQQTIFSMTQCFLSTAIHNRYFNRDFSAGSTIQVVVGVNNQASTVPATFTLKMYKWYYSPTNYGLLI